MKYISMLYFSFNPITKYNHSLLHKLCKHFYRHQFTHIQYQGYFCDLPFTPKHTLAINKRTYLLLKFTCHRCQCKKCLAQRTLDLTSSPVNVLTSYFRAQHEMLLCWQKCNKVTSYQFECKLSHAQCCVLQFIASQNILKDL